MSGYNELHELFDEQKSQQPFDTAERFYRELFALRRMHAESDDEAFETVPTTPTPIVIPSGFRMGVWLDVGGRSLVTHGARHAALLYDLGFSDACIMVNQVEDRTFAFNAVSESTIRSFAALLAGSGIRLTLTAWLRPDRSYINDLVYRLVPLARDIGAHGIEVDVESPWRSGHVHGFANHTEAADYFYSVLRRVSQGMELAATCEVDPMPMANMQAILRGADIVIPQAYSKAGADQTHQVGGSYGPRGIQDRAVQRLADAVAMSGKPTILGLASWARQGWSRVTPNDIMRMELEHSLSLRSRATIQGVRYWSWKHIAGFDGRGGRPANSYGRDFFRTAISSPGAAWMPQPASRTASTMPGTSPSTPSPTTTPTVTTRTASPPKSEFQSEWEWNESSEYQPIVLPTPSADRAAPASAEPRAIASRVLHTVHVELPLTRERIQAAKLYDAATDSTLVRAVDIRGTTVDLQSKIQAETCARLRRHRQVHPVLMRAIQQASAEERIPILAWIHHEHELAPKDRAEDANPLLVASRESATTALRRPDDTRADAYTESLRTNLRPVLERARLAFRELGVEVSADLGTVPMLIAQATREQVQALSRLPDVTGLYLHEPQGFPDIASSVADARAAAAHTSGFKGANVHVGVWETTPASTAQLTVEDTFDGTAAGQAAHDRNHAQLVTAVIKNKQISGPKGFAPDAKIFSANKYSTDALNWAIVTKHCTVINQSFHRSSEETDPGLSADDLIKDYLIVHPPFPTIVQAAGNGPSTEYVNHKGFNSVTVGNHVDGAGAMDAQSVFKNPSSTHRDRELPDLSANGMTVSATGITMSGTSFSSPAVAGTAAVIQSIDGTLKSWPEGCRAILLASAGRNISGGTWSQATRSPGTDSVDGSGALDTGEAARIARIRTMRNGSAVRCGWDVGMLQTSDLQANGTSNFKYSIQVPVSGVRRLKAALAWSSKIVYTSDATITPPVKVTESKLTVDLDLYIYRDGRLVAHSSTFDNSFEIVEFEAQVGTTYDIRIKRFSGTDWVWYGLAWNIT